jgi:serine/threonine protein kinase
MVVTDLLILPGDVMLIPVEELRPDLRDRLECQESDFAISRRRARAPSLVIDHAAAQLLGEFRTPKTIIEAILSYSRAKQTDPEVVLDSAFPLLQRLCNSRLLVPFGSEEAKLIEPNYEAGSVVAGFEVVRCAQVLEDTEVYQVRNRDGHLCAMKSMRPAAPGHVVEAFAREAVLLAHLDRLHTPALLAHGELGGNLYLIMEWCEGTIASIAAERLCRAENDKAAFALLELCGAILEAYAHVHAQNVVHSDVHPRNILIGVDNSVKIVDFGLARFEKSRPGFQEPGRGGIGFYFEPEYAAACLTGETTPVASRLGEQYALGALLYLLFTGRHYLDFSLEREKLLGQIVQDAPLPFSRRGVRSLDEVERVLTKALAKNPSARYPSVEEFARQLKLAGDSSPTHLTGGAASRSPQDNAAGAGLIQTVLTRLSTSGDLIWSGLSLAPTCSVTFGAAGIAYMFYRIACLRNDPRLLSVADLWSNRANEAGNQAAAFYNRELEITEQNVDPASLYHTACGVYCVEALISHAMGDLGSARTALHAFVLASSRLGKNLDLTLGSSGTLIGCTTLMEAMPAQLIEETSLLNRGATVLDSMWSRIVDYAPMPECRELQWLGIAHGWAGILFATLRWCQAAGITIPSPVEERLWQLSECAESTGRSVCWSRRVHDDVVWPGWCHGTAGYVHLWLLAHQLYHEEKFLHLAQGSAWHTWENSNGDSSSLCCGLAGQAYALLSLYKYTGSNEWLTRARTVGALAVSDAGSPKLRANSLYKGDVGIALLAAELFYPELSCMPLFGSE